MEAGHKESDGSWRVANPTESAAEPRFVYRSLAMLRVQLSQTRVATSSKIRAEYASRRQGNIQATAVLQSNLEIWLAVRGPDLQSLADPGDEAVRQAMAARESLVKLQEKHAGSEEDSNAEEFCGHCIAAIDALKSTNFERIRLEKVLGHAGVALRCARQGLAWPRAARAGRGAAERSLVPRSATLCLRLRGN